MRPRVFPAEDTTSAAAACACATSFNEAAGIPRGRRDEGRLRAGVLPLASMRPRVFPAEDFRACVVPDDEGETLQ